MTIYTIPLYDTLGESAVEYCVKHSEATVLFVSTVNWPKLAKTLPSLPDVHTVVYWGPSAVDTSAVKALGKKVFSFAEFLQLGRQNPSEPHPPKSSDICTIMYTSGTTGTPKGVVLTHASVLASMAGMKDTVLLMDRQEPLNSKDSYLSYLPLAHILDRMFEEMLLHLGGRIGYFSGDVKKLPDDLVALRPTIFVGVPRVYDRIYAGATGQIEKAGGLKKWLFNTAFKSKLKALKQGKHWRDAAPFWDKLVFSKIKARLGGNVRIAISGAAPLSPHVEDFLRVALCSFFGQGYGLTESCAGNTLALTQDMEYTIGSPCPSVEYRLESIPELKYDAFAEPPRGEICLRGPCLFSGYYKAEDKTTEVVDTYGFFHTGDVGELTPSGGLRIIDRKKQIFKLSQGEYVAIEKIESVYKQVKLIAQIWGYGDSMQDKLVAVIVPDPETFPGFCQKEGLQGSYKDLVHNPRAEELVLREMNAVAKQGGLRGFEMIRGVILEDDMFSVENELLTPTFKMKRPQLQAKYKEAIADKYKILNASK